MVQLKADGGTEQS